MARMDDISYWFKQNPFVFVKRGKESLLLEKGQEWKEIPDDMEVVHLKLLDIYRGPPSIRRSFFELLAAIRERVSTRRL